MCDDIDKSLPTATTFRFSSGELLTLDQNQIDKIPYLSAIVSSADRFVSARDDEGYLKLDPCINYEDLMFIVKSTSFTFIRQLFTHLPRETNVISIIALWNFLGLDSQCHPSLKEVDLFFFSSVVYNPITEQHLRIVKPAVVQEMAVRFAIAIVKEEYDFSNDEVIDHVYWLVMFVLSAHKFFGKRLRHHMHTIAENCFSVFKPSQLKALNRLKEKMDYDAKKRLSKRYYIVSDNCISDCLHLDEVSCDYYAKYNERKYAWFGIYSSLYQEDRYQDSYFSNYWFIRKVKTDEDLLKPAYEHALKTIYGRLQNQICQRAIAALRNREVKIVIKVDLLEYFQFRNIHRCLALPYKIESLFKSKRVQEQICDLVLEELSILTVKLKQEHIQLQQKLQLHKPDENTSLEHSYFRWIFIWRNDVSSYESVQEETLHYALLLDKLDHSSNTVVKEIEQRVYKSLCDAALKQLNNWLNTQDEIDQLHEFLKPDFQWKDLLVTQTKTNYQRYKTPVPKHAPKFQLKFGKR